MRSPTVPEPGSNAAAAPVYAEAAPPRRPKRKSRRRWYILGTLILLGAVATLMILRGRQEKPIAVTAEAAERRNITQLVSATGKIQPETEVKISPEVAGEIIDLPVVDGQIVKRGDLLIRIKPDNYKAQVAQQEAAIAAAKATSMQNHAQLERATEDLKRYADLYSRKVINESDMTLYKTNAQVAQATYDASRAQIEQAESLLSQSRDLLEKTQIFSPIDGIISVLSVKQGERVVATGQFAGTEVMRVADLGTMEARVNVNENDVVTVKVGDEAAIAIDAFPNRSFRGKVYQIANTAVTSSANTQEEVTNFEVRIRIAMDGAQLRPGMSTTADVETATVAKAISVPIQAVTVRNLADSLSPEERDKQKAKTAAQDAAADPNSVELDKNKAASDRDKSERNKLQKVVFVRLKDTVQIRKVETGIADNTYLEIKKGLQPGESVVSGPYRAISRLLKSGSKITLDKAN